MTIHESLKKIASTEGFKPYDGNPIIDVRPDRSFDAGALGSMAGMNRKYSIW
jgi:hypothetical protein